MRSYPRDLDQIMTTMAWFWVDWLGDLSPFQLLKFFGILSFKVVGRRMDLPVSVDGKIVVFQSMFRTDYDEMVTNVVNGLGGDAVYVDIELQNVRRASYNRNVRVGFGQALWRLYRAISEGFTHRQLWRESWRGRGFIVATVLFLYFIKFRIDCNELLDRQPRSVVVFAEMQPLDRVLSMVCAERSIPCVTMQHGLYAEYLEIDTINRFNYQPLFVSRFLAWGENTAQLVSRYAPDLNVVVCGKPTLDCPERPAGEAVYDAVVIMDQNIFTKENQAMLDMAKEALPYPDFRKGLRLHPRNDVSDYQIDGFEIVKGDEWLKTRLCLGHTTSFLVDVLQIGIPVVRYNSGAETVFEDEQVEFTNTDELRKLIASELPKPDLVLKKFVLQRGERSIHAHVQAILGMN